MKLQQLRYDHDVATRYTDPPSTVKLETPTLDLVDHYETLTALTRKAKAAHAALVTEGIFQSIPTLTVETKNGRPGSYWRAVFKTNSPEVLHGKPRKHYIGSDEDKVQEWKDWIARTRRAMKLNQYIHDVGWTLKRTYNTIEGTSAGLAAQVQNCTMNLELLTP